MLNNFCKPASVVAWCEARLKMEHMGRPEHLCELDGVRWIRTVDVGIRLHRKIERLHLCRTSLRAQ